MASSMIHLTIANELNKMLKRDKKKLLLGSIAPDLSKLVGDDKTRSHFILEGEEDIPDLNKFLKKYGYFLNDDFVLGYYIHLYSDYLWFKYFIPDLFDEGKNIITKLNGDIIKCNGNMMEKYIYNDYTNINNDLINEYDLDLKLFYEPIPELNNIIDEIPIDKISLIVDKTGLIIENSKKTKELIFDIEQINNFIKMNVEIIYSNLKELKIVE